MMQPYENLGTPIVALAQIKTGITVYEFGTYEGNTLCAIDWLCRANGLYLDHIYAFDSFEGLCEEEEGIPKLEGWVPGTFSLTSFYKDATLKQIIDALTYKVNIPGLKVFPGFYSESLTDELAKTLSVADLVHVDCDLYISTKQVLDWLFRNKLVKKDTVICYDEYFSIAGGGEERAHKEMVEKYNVKCIEAWSNEETPGGIIRKDFVITSI